MKKIYSLFAALVLAGGLNAQAEDVTLSFPHVQWADVVLSQGWWQLYGYDTTNQYYINVSPNYTDHLDGEYSVYDMYYAKMYHKDELAPDGTATIQFTDGPITLTTSPYEVIMNVDCNADDGNHYLCDVHGFPHYNYYLTGDSEVLGDWDLKKAAYMHRDSLARVFDPGVYEFKILINEESFTDAIDGARLDTENSSSAVTGGEVTDPITLTLTERSIVLFAVQENKAIVSVLDEVPLQITYDGENFDMYFDNKWDGFVTENFVWKHLDITLMDLLTYTVDDVKYWTWNEEAQDWTAAEEPAVGTECTLVYNPVFNYFEALYVNAESAISEVNADADLQPAKSLRDGQMTITRNGISYNAQGMRK